MRLLLVGRPATSLSERLNQLTQGAITLDVARLPAEAIRRFEEVPPDAILVCDEAGGGRVSTLVKAIKHRPLGQLVPLILICPQPASQEDAQALARELELHAWLDPEVSAQELCRVLAAELEVAYEALVPESQRVSPMAAHQSQDEPARSSSTSDAFEAGYIIEPLDEPPADPADELAQSDPQDRPTHHALHLAPTSPVAALDRAQLFPVRAHQRQSGKVTIDVIRRKLKDVRHEDYYTILEVRRGVDGPMVRQAYQTLMSRFDPETLDFELSRRFFHELAEIRDAFDDAYAVLGDPTLREGYTLAGTKPLGR